MSTNPENPYAGKPSAELRTALKWRGLYGMVYLGEHEKRLVAEWDADPSNHHHNDNCEGGNCAAPKLRPGASHKIGKDIAA